MRPRLLDLFCSAGGAAVGYDRAGFEVVGVDLDPQPNYPFRFVQCDWADFIRLYGTDTFQAIHASPPCQRYSQASRCCPSLAETYPDLVAPVREALKASGLPWVIENVPGAPLIEPTMLCGQMFGLDLFRHRMFESSFPLPFMLHAHTKVGSKAGYTFDPTSGKDNGGWRPGRIISVAGNCSPIAEAKRAMGIDWMSRHELAEAIPPAYTEHIGKHLLAANCTIQTDWSLPCDKYEPSRRYRDGAASHL
jgi:DNA (cytosine-5)-methyltransferase 1